MAYTALAYYAKGNAGVRDVGVKTLAKRVNVGESTLKLGLIELEKAGAIQVKKRFVKKAGLRQQLPNEYILLDIKSKETPDI